MKSEEFMAALENAVQEYIDNFDRYDHNPQLRVNPETLAVDVVDGSDLADEVEDSDEVVENAAAAQGMASQEDAEYQVTLNPDFYAVKPLLKATADGGTRPDKAALRAIAAVYF